MICLPSPSIFSQSVINHEPIQLLPASVVDFHSIPVNSECLSSVYDQFHSLFRVTFIIFLGIYCLCNRILANLTIFPFLSSIFRQSHLPLPITSHLIIFNSILLTFLTLPIQRIFCCCGLQTQKNNNDDFRKKKNNVSIVFFSSLPV